ncbi:uncharacterized protein LOC135195820 [Macrobrachium nipponense]|uniref:uncharacterized protein LOC135195820 n=1 Tax=Macrobrachium nipponense TaxID=159736 RepID=UPI0030C8CC35
MWNHWNGLEHILIEMIHERECLWKPDDPGYYNRSLKERNIIEIAEFLQLPPYEIKKKWHSMRVYFVKEWKKVEESRRNATSLDEIYKPKFKWFSNMMFIKDVKASFFREDGNYGEDELKPSSSSSGSSENRINVVDIKEEENDYHSDHFDQRLLPEVDEANTGGEITYLQDLRERRKRRFEHKSTEVDAKELTPSTSSDNNSGVGEGPRGPAATAAAAAAGNASCPEGNIQERIRPPESCRNGGSSSSSSPAMSTIFYLQKHDTFGLSVSEQLRAMSQTQVTVAKLRIQQVLFEVSTLRESTESTYDAG